MTHAAFVGAGSESPVRSFPNHLGLIQMTRDIGACLCQRIVRGIRKIMIAVIPFFQIRESEGIEIRDFMGELSAIDPVTALAIKVGFNNYGK